MLDLTISTHPHLNWHANQHTSAVTIHAPTQYASKTNVEKIWFHFQFLFLYVSFQLPSHSLPNWRRTAYDLDWLHDTEACEPTTGAKRRTQNYDKIL